MKPVSSRTPGAGISRGMWIALAATLALTATSYGVRSWREASHAAKLEEAAAEVDAAPATAPVSTANTPVTPPSTAPTSVSTPAPSPAPLAPPTATEQAAAPTAPPPPSAQAEGADEPITIINPANGLPMTLPPGTPLPPGMTPVAKPAKPASVVAPPPQPVPATMSKIQLPSAPPPMQVPAPLTTPATAPAPAGLRPSLPGPASDAMASRRAAPPSAAAPVSEAPAPVATLPAPSFRLIGRYLDGSHSVAFLAHGDTVIAAKAGDSLPDGFKLRSIRPSGIIVLRLANKEKIEMMLVTP